MRVLHFSISREVSLRNLVTTIKTYYNHMCKKCYFPRSQKMTSKNSVHYFNYISVKRLSFQKTLSYIPFPSTWIQRYSLCAFGLVDFSVILVQSGDLTQVLSFFLHWSNWLSSSPQFSILHRIKKAGKGGSLLCVWGRYFCFVVLFLRQIINSFFNSYCVFLRKIKSVQQTQAQSHYVLSL